MTPRLPHCSMLVALTGFKQSGKDEAAKILVEEFGFIQYAFADALRELCLRINPTIDMTDVPEDVQACVMAQFGNEKRAPRWQDVLQALTYEKAKSVPDVRRFMQRLGTEGIRHVFGADAWINALELRMRSDAQAKAARSTTPYSYRAVISDLRFINENKWIPTCHVPYQIWRVLRPGCVSDGHASEKEIDSLVVTHALSNSGTLKFHRENVRLLAQQLPSC